MSSPAGPDPPAPSRPQSFTRWPPYDALFVCLSSPNDRPRRSRDTICLLRYKATHLRAKVIAVQRGRKASWFVPTPQPNRVSPPRGKTSIRQSLMNPANRYRYGACFLQRQLRIVGFRQHLMEPPAQTPNTPLTTGHGPWFTGVVIS